MWGNSAAPLVHATLFGSDRCEALGVTGHDSAPVLALCRALVEAGHAPCRPLHVCRGAVLGVATLGVGFERIPECTGDALIRRNTPNNCGVWQ